jgi:hypothetical protein
MNDLLDFVIERHGGIDRWHEASTVSATVRVHGGFWAFKGQPDRRLEATFPDEIATHSTVQTYYFDSDTGVQRRMDYSPDVNGKNKEI